MLRISIDDKRAWITDLCEGCERSSTKNQEVLLNDCVLCSFCLDAQTSVNNYLHEGCERSSTKRSRRNEISFLYCSFSLLVQRKRTKRKDPFAEEFLPLAKPLENSASLCSCSRSFSSHILHLRFSNTLISDIPSGWLPFNKLEK